MSLRTYIWGIRIITLISLGACIFVIKSVDPDISGLIGKIIFYLSVFFFLSGLFNLILLGLRKKSIVIENVSANISLSFRQGILLALFCIGLLILQSFRMLVWWDGLLLLLGIFIIELYFVSREE
jgi:hypothetical protein